MAGNAYQLNLSQPEEEKNGYTSRDVYRIIAQTSEYDQDGARNLYQKFMAAQQDVTSKYYNPYSQATNKAVSNLQNYGFDINNLNDDWLNKNSNWITSNLIYNGTTNTPSKPTKKATWEQNVAYELYQWHKSEATTKKAEQEWEALQEELSYWAQRPDRNYSDDYIMSHIDWSKYKTLASMDENKYYAPTELNRAIGYSEDAMYGILWAARNPEYRGDLFGAIANSAMGEGGWVENPEITAKLNWNDKETYSPYEVGMTLSDEGLYFGIFRFGEEQIKLLREGKDPRTGEPLNPDDRTAMEMQESVLKAEEKTEELEGKLAAMNEDIFDLVMNYDDPDYILEILRDTSDADHNYSALFKLDDTMISGDLVKTTREINYRWKDVEQRVRDMCAKKQELVGAGGVAGAVDGALGVQGQNKVLALKNALSDVVKALFADGNDVEKNILNTWDGTFDAALDSINNRAGDYEQAYGRKLNDDIKGQYLPATRFVYDYDKHNQNREELQSTLDDVNKELEGLRDREKSNIVEMDDGSQIDISYLVNLPDWQYYQNALENPDTAYEDVRDNALFEIYQAAHPDDYFGDNYDEATAEAYWEAVKGKITPADVNEVPKPLTREEKERADALGQRSEELEKMIQDEDKYLADNDEAYKDAQWQRDNMMQSIAGIQGADPSILPAIDYLFQASQEYVPKEWYAYNMYDQAYREGKITKEDASARAMEVVIFGTQEADMLRSMLERSNEFGISFSDEERKNVERRIEYLENDALVNAYVLLDDEEDFAKVVEETKQKAADFKEYNVGEMLDRAMNQDQNDFTRRMSKHGYGLLGKIKSILKITDEVQSSYAIEDYEWDRFYYLLGKEGEEAAQKYLNLLLDPDDGVVTVRNSIQTNEYVKEFAQSSPVGALAATITSFGTNILAGPDALSYFAKQKVKGEEVSPYNYSYKNMDITNAARAGSKEWINNICGGEDTLGAQLFNLIYDGGTSALDSHLNATMMSGFLGDISGIFQETKFGKWLMDKTGDITKAASGRVDTGNGSFLDRLISKTADGKGVGGFVVKASKDLAHASQMGASSAMATYRDVIMNHGSEEQAIMMAIATFFAETGSEAITVGNIHEAISKGGDEAHRGLKDLLMLFVKNAGEEFLGEAGNEWITANADRIIMGELSEYEKTVQSFVDKGYPTSLARQLADKEMWKGILRSGIVGAISSSFGTPGEYINGMMQDRVNEQNKVIDEVANAAQESAQQEAKERRAELEKSLVSLQNAMNADSSGSAVAIAAALNTGNAKAEKAAAQAIVASLAHGDSNLATKAMHSILLTGGGGEQLKTVLMQAALTDGEGHIALRNVIEKVGNGERVTAKDVKDISDSLNNDKQSNQQFNEQMQAAVTDNMVANRTAEIAQEQAESLEADKEDVKSKQENLQTRQRELETAQNERDAAAESVVDAVDQQMEDLSNNDHNGDVEQNLNHLDGMDSKVVENAERNVAVAQQQHEDSKKKRAKKAKKVKEDAQQQASAEVAQQQQQEQEVAQQAEQDEYNQLITNNPVTKAFGRVMQVPANNGSTFEATGIYDVNPQGTIFRAKDGRLILYKGEINDPGLQQMIDSFQTDNVSDDRGYNHPQGAPLAYMEQSIPAKVKASGESIWLEGLVGVQQKTDARGRAYLDPVFLGSDGKTYRMRDLRISNYDIDYAYEAVGENANLPVIEAPANNIQAYRESTEEADPDAEAYNAAVDAGRKKAAQMRVAQIAEQRGMNKEQAEAFARAAVNYMERQENAKTDLNASVTTSEGKRLINRMAKRLGLEVKYENMAEGFNGSYENGVVTLSNNLTTGQAMIQIAMHEITHALERTNSYQAYSDLVMDILFKGDEAARQKAIQDKIDEYKGNDVDLTPEKAMKEIVADFAKDHLATPETMKRIVDRGLGGRFRAILHNINQFFKNRTLTGKERAQADKFKEAERLLKQAMNELAWKNMSRYSQEQVKNAQEETKKALANPKPQFSLSSRIEARTDGLIAVHNLDVRGLMSDLKMGGFPMPSIAVLPSNSDYWGQYSYISIFFDQGAIDPEYGGRIYTGDAWTPSFGGAQINTAQEGVDFLRAQKERDYEAGDADTLAKHFNNFWRVRSVEQAREYANRKIDSNTRALKSSYRKEYRNYLREMLTKNGLLTENDYDNTPLGSKYEKYISRGIFEAYESLYEENADGHMTQEEIAQRYSDKINEWVNEGGLKNDVDWKDPILLSIAQKYADLLVSTMQSNFMEAKPNGIVSFDHIRAVMLPANTPGEVIEALIDAGIPGSSIHFYDGILDAQMQALSIPAEDSRQNVFDEIQRNVGGAVFSVGNEEAYRDALIEAGFNQTEADLATDYQSALANGDMEQAANDVKTYAQNKGYKLHGFHGTNAVFTVFDPNKLGSKNWNAGSAYLGFFAAKSRATAEAYTGLNSIDYASLMLNEESSQKMEQIKQENNFEEVTRKNNEAKEKFEQEYKSSHGYAEEVETPMEIFRSNGFFDNFSEEQLNSFRQIHEYRWNEKHLNDMLRAWEQTDEAKEYQEYTESLTKTWEDYEIQRKGYVPNVMDLYIKMEKPFVYDFKGEERDVESFAARMAYAREKGYDGCIFQNVADGADIDDIYAVFTNTQLKSADTVTYDDNGNVIPLEERFSDGEDIRYSIGDSMMENVLREAGLIQDNNVQGNESASEETSTPEAPVQQTPTQTQNNKIKAKYSPLTIAQNLAKSLKIGGYVPANNFGDVNAESYFDPASESVVMRTKNAGDYTKLFHEFGHFFAKRFGLEPTTYMMNNFKVVDPTFFDGSRGYDPSEIPDEAIGEFMWRYMESEDNGRSFAGDEFYDNFEAAIRNTPEGRALAEARTQFQMWLNADAFEKMHSVIVNRSDKSRIALGDHIQNAIDALVDSTSAAQGFDDTIRELSGGDEGIFNKVRQMALWANTAGKQATSILMGSGLTDAYGTVIGKSLKDMIADTGFRANGKNLDILNTYMLALHSIDRDKQNKPVFDSHISQEERQAWINRIEKQVPHLKEAAQAIQSFRKQFLQEFLVNTGRLTQEAFDKMNEMYPNYVPTFRVKNTDAIAQRTGKGKTFKIQRAKGSTENIYNPFDSFCSMVNTIVSQNALNRAGLAFDRMYHQYEGLGDFAHEVVHNPAEKAATPIDMTTKMTQVHDLVGDMLDSQTLSELMKIVGGSGFGQADTESHNTLKVVRPDGTVVEYEFENLELFKLLAGVNDKSADALISAFGFLTRGMSALTTGSNPLFAVRNFMRDFQNSVNYGSWASNYGSGVLKWLASAYQVFTGSDDYKDYVALGGGGWTRVDPSRVASRNELYSGIFKGYNTGNTGRTAKWLMKKVWNGVTLAKLNEVVEQASRFAEYEYGKHNLETSEGRVEGYLAAQEATVDFNRSGNNRLAVTLKKLVPFFNASMQGVYRTGRMLTKAERGRAPARFTKTVINTSLLSALSVALLKANMDDDDKREFEMLSDDLKAKHFYLPNFAPDIFGESPLIRIPLAQDPLTYAIHGAVTNALWNGDTEDGMMIDLAATVDTILDNLNPLGSGTIFEPILGVAMNRSWYGNKIVPAYLERNTFAPDQYAEDTPDFFVEASRYLHEGTNGAVSMSPMKLQYLFEQYTGYVGQLLIPAISKDSKGNAGGINATINAARKKLTSDPLTSNDVISSFYDGSDIINNIVQEANQGKPLNILRRGLTKEEAGRAYEEAKELSTGIIANTKTKVNEIYTRIDAINENPDLTDREKYKQTSEYRREMIQLVLDANEAIGAYRDTYITGGNMVTRMLTAGTPSYKPTKKEKLPDIFKADENEDYMVKANEVYQATNSDAALPHPSKSMDVTNRGKVKDTYEISDEEWPEYEKAYRSAYKTYMDRNTKRWDTLNTDKKKTLLTNAHTAGNEAVRKLYKKEHPDIDKNTTGRYGKGNIDLNNRKVVRNEDGSISTEVSMSFYDEDSEKEVLIPTVINGKIVSEEEAIDHYYRTGEYLGKFDTPDEADRYAEELHRRQDWYYNR